jgi:PEP-CTERM motif
MSTTTWSGSILTEVYQSGSVFTYVYEFTLNPNSVEMSQFTTATALGQDFFDNTLDWGVVTGLTTNGTGSFTFGASSFKVDVSGLGGNGLPGGKSTATEKFAFYAQSYHPSVPGNYTGQDGGRSVNADALAPGVPEPASMFLLGTALFGMAFLLGRKKAQS